MQYTHGLGVESKILRRGPAGKNTVYDPVTVVRRRPVDGRPSTQCLEPKFNSQSHNANTIMGFPRNGDRNFISADGNQVNED